MKERNIVRYSPKRLPKGKTDWAAVDAMSDKEIERRAAGDPDTRLTTPAFWRNARLVLPAGTGKDVVTLRLDRDVLKWFKGRGRGYQTRINAILRAYMLAEEDRG
ncbi:MAG: BrnA antitoxin family protein [bacterium]